LPTLAISATNPQGIQIFVSLEKGQSASHEDALDPGGIVWLQEVCDFCIEEPELAVYLISIITSYSIQAGNDTSPW
jgi:hypothetical protein